MPPIWPAMPMPMKAMAGPALVLAAAACMALGLCADKMGRRPGGVHKGRVALQLLDHLLVFLIGLDAGNAEGDDLHAPQIPPLGGELLVEGVSQLQWCGREGRSSGCPFR